MKNHRMMLHTFVLLAAILAAGSPVSAMVTLVEDAQPCAVVVHNGHTKEGGILCEYIQKITGAALPVAATEAEVPAGMSAVVLRLVEKVPGASDRITAEHAYLLKTADGRLHVAAQTALGLEYAVYGLLQDHLGVGFYTHEYEHIPNSPTLAVPELNDLQEPAFYGRGMMLWNERKRIADWANKNRNYPPDGGSITSHHNFASYGTREHCPLDPEFHKKFAEQLKEQFAKRDASAPPMALGQMDGPFKLGCNRCEKCDALIEEEGSFAAPMHVMLSAVMEIAGEEYPEHRIITFAYNNTLPVPKTIRPHKNVWINIASSGGDHLNPLRDNSAMQNYHNALRDWPKVAPGRVTTWHWAKNYHAGAYEWPNMYTIVDVIRLWKEYDIGGGFMQQDRTLYNWCSLKHWVWSQLLWNPEQDEDALIMRFMREYYGEKAAPILFEYIKTGEEIRREKDLRISVVRGNSFPRALRQSLLTPDVVERFDTILAEALEAARQEDNPIYAKHVERARAWATDMPIIDMLREEQGFDFVTDPRDGSRWYVAGGRADVPERIERYVERTPDPRFHLWFHTQAGGRVYQLESDELSVAAVPDKRGRLVALTYKPTGAGIFAGEGYADHPRIRQHEWRVEQADENTLNTHTRLSQEYWGFVPLGYIKREVSVNDDGLTVRRRYRIQRLWREQALPAFFNARWGWKLSEPSAARLHIRGGGIDRMYEGGDLLDEAFEVELAGDDGQVVIELDRGDGLLVRLETPAAGWKGVEIRPFTIKPGEELQKHTERRRTWWPGDTDVWPVDQTERLEITLLGAEDTVISKDEVSLPKQRLTIRSK